MNTQSHGFLMSVLIFAKLVCVFMAAIVSCVVLLDECALSVPISVAKRVFRL